MITTDVQSQGKLNGYLTSLADKLKKGEVAVGVPASSGSYDGISVVEVAAINEFGTARIPERSFLRVPLNQSRDKLGKALEHAAKSMIDGKSDFTAMSQVGAMGAAICQEAISNGIAPANKPSTIQKKGSSTPLIDTGNLRQSITYVVGGDNES